MLQRFLILGTVLVAVMNAFHLLIAYRHSVPHADVWALVSLGLAAVVIAIGSWLMRPGLSRRPYAFLVFHVVSYVVTVGSIAVHSLVASWPTQLNGGLVWMVGIWSIGLLVHSYASIAHRGFADADA